MDRTPLPSQFHGPLTLSDDNFCQFFIHKLCHSILQSLLLRLSRRPILPARSS